MDIPPEQTPEPGRHVLGFRGDLFTFHLRLPAAASGNAWLRSNLGHAAVARREIIRSVHAGHPSLGRDWFDLPMRRVDARTFAITVPLLESGHFEAKCFFKPEAAAQPVWPPGPNASVNVCPARSCCANTVYNAFVRQFGPNKSGGENLDEPRSAWARELEETGFAVIPPSGTFRDLIRELDFIIGHLGCRFIQLLPVHPTPTTYGRMGRFGSPYASLSFTAVDPALARFDPVATPLEQFQELADAVHARGAGLIIDIAINHTGWAARLHETHPQWLVRDAAGRIEVPGAWGVMWEDLAKLDYRHRGLWRYMAEVFLTWCRRGVDGFRCDAGYMIPADAWRYMTARVREQFPDTLFFLEGLGGKISATRAILDTATFDWAYSELFQNYDRRQISAYLPEAAAISEADGLMVHFAETHDNPRLAATSIDYARMRTALCALFSFNGAFAFANGVEWFATEKIDVHGAPSLNWGAEPNQVDQIRRLNLLLGIHPAFHADVKTQLVQEGPENVVVLKRRHRPSGRQLLVAANLDAVRPSQARWPSPEGRTGKARFVDLLTGKAVCAESAGQSYVCDLSPAEVLCLTEDERDLARLETALSRTAATPERIVDQLLQAKVLEVFEHFKGLRDMEDFEPRAAVRALQEDPAAFCRELNPDGDEPRVVTWHWPEDCRREVMVPPGHLLLVRAASAFRARVVQKRRTLAAEVSLPAADGSGFALIRPHKTPRRSRSVTLEMAVFEKDGCRHGAGPLRYLGRGRNPRLRCRRRRPALLQGRHIFLGTNGGGAMLRAAGVFGELYSRYDALLAANLNPALPEDRWIMLTRCRAWVVFQDYSQAVGRHCLQSFHAGRRSRAVWLFDLPTGQGQHIVLSVGVQMLPSSNRIRMAFARHRAGKTSERLPDDLPVRLIVRPDIENRSFHAVTKAYQGPEHQWPAAVHPQSDGFAFAPDAHRRLTVRMPGARFVAEPEWHYMVERPLESERGLDPHSDLFSPGYLAANLNGGQALMFEAAIETPPASAPAQLTDPRPPRKAPDAKDLPLPTALEAALDHYLVRREGLHSVIAGYPWFLDWGRDALIFARGLAATGRLAEARDIVKLFGRLEQHGTLPNMIRGSDAANRDTSDAPLWWITVCADIIRAEKSAALLGEPCGGRTVAEVLASILDGFAAGTPNGIRMDPQTGLVFSPAHFTWMDTNHPAGTPRQGYPIEIQSLWCAALRTAARLAPHQQSLAAASDRWRRMAERVAESVVRYFVHPNGEYLADCLHAAVSEAPPQAVSDDALRPNQLFALTLETVGKTGLGPRILAACETLLIPGAVRSLADRPLKRPLVIEHGGKTLGDPHHPYRGRYEGDENTQRKPAYHNGTAWTWLFPSFCEAWVKVYGPTARPTARAWLASSLPLVEGGCVGHVPEICDGDCPHTPRGCDAQAWGASEWLRVWRMLEDA